MKAQNTLCLATTFAALRGDDVAAFRTLYHHFEPQLYAFALHLVRQREEAEEIVQEVFLKVWERRHTLDATLNFDGYLYRIARHLVYNKARHRVYEQAFRQYVVAAGIPTSSCTEEALAYQEVVALLEEIYATLPPIRRQVFLLSRVEGKSNSEIAQLLNTSKSNIENHLHKALKTIREKFKPYESVYTLALLSYWLGHP
ncbi:RNA polymerase sigma-70 factor, ECF subfamily [Catalinimonas alkaloidigena]|uniref:RNA polymerase sigma-70 factor, ECF subfamily n=1 Tax=Catalinimonas alkaloidigena TaxID=1075417 RepID=A0A1G9P476_9BACT|nr:RNA polymerase sigma-70 factor [Catalinimonas alkaloidigena]SDL93005.1 RNA polymerase sigma-70 factor, ECF subfamily [Catalinimonas alkaloidigena]